MYTSVCKYTYFYCSKCSVAPFHLSNHKLSLTTLLTTRFVEHVRAIQSHNEKSIHEMNSIRNKIIIHKGCMVKYKLAYTWRFTKSFNFGNSSIKIISNTSSSRCSYLFSWKQVSDIDFVCPTSFVSCGVFVTYCVRHTTHIYNIHTHILVLYM